MSYRHGSTHPVLECCTHRLPGAKSNFSFGEFCDARFCVTNLSPKFVTPEIASQIWDLEFVTPSPKLVTLSPNL